MVTCTKAVAFRLEALDGRLLKTGTGLLPAMAAPTADVAAESDPGQVTGVTDPRIFKQGDTYYLFSTGSGIPIRTSNDLTHWSEAGQVFAAVPSWALGKVPGATSIWAPDISYIDGQYHLYYAVSTFGSQRSVIGLATNTTLDPSAPGYQWVDQGEVMASRPGRNNYNAIDPNLVLDSRSGPWLAFGSQWSGIKLVRIDPATGKPQGGHSRLRTLATRPVGRPIEAPFIFERNGYNYLFVSFDRCCMGVSSTYKIMVGRSRSIDGPYLDRSGRPMTRGGGTLVLASNARFHGPGHNEVLADGNADVLVYDTNDALNHGIPTLQIRPLVWTANEWPVVGDPLF